MSPRAARRLFVPEVVQTSAMDCGPATLKCLLEGFGINVSYGRLREACQTDVDGTSIDTLEEIAIQLGLDAEQMVVPADHLLLPESKLLPALVVTRQPSGPLHFVLVWRRHGRFLQVMDPSRGRRWVSCDAFLSELYIHSTAVPAAGWREWAASAAFLTPFRRRLASLAADGSSSAAAPGEALIDGARDAPGWMAFARLDAATRMVETVVMAGGVERGPQAMKLLAQVLASAGGERTPASFWSVRPAAPDADGDELLTLRGVVLMSVRGHRVTPEPVANNDDGEPADAPARPLTQEMLRALEQPSARPWQTLAHLIKAQGPRAPSLLVGALLLAAAATMCEAVLLRGLLEVGRDLGIPSQRLGGMTVVLTFLAALLLVDVPIVAGLLRLGRHLETRLRVALLEKIPRIGDRYFATRLLSDMAERSHAVQSLRQLPQLAGQVLRSSFQLIFTTAGIIWLAPGSAPLAIAAAVVAAVVPLAAQPILAERDLRLRSHVSGLTRFYLDALLGMTAIRAHGADSAMRREQEGLLTSWVHAAKRVQRAAISIEAAQAISGLGLAAWLVLRHLAHASMGGGGMATGSVLLLAYWALGLPAIGQELALAARQVPALRNITLRLLEPLEAAEESPSLTQSACAPFDERTPSGGVAIELKRVSVRAGGHLLLDSIDVSIGSSSHVAVVGSSGAGKSTLVGLLLGFSAPSQGSMTIDGTPSSDGGLASLRRATAWVDPSVQLWNAPFLDNLLYGSPEVSAARIGEVIEAAQLRKVLEKLPDGLQTPLGEGGALVSGGEGQRIRIGRAMARPHVRLVILDEPFRGLDREHRRRLLSRAREHWAGATLVCITHDIAETQEFDRVLVIDGGKLVEDDAPTVLARSTESRYHALLKAENEVHEELWADKRWRRLRVDHGRVFEVHHGNAEKAARAGVAS